MLDENLAAMDDLSLNPSDARRIAFRRAIAIGAACGLGCLIAGKSFENASIDGAIVALGGLITWTTYHLISGRPDGFRLVFLNTLPVWRLSKDPWLPTLVITSLAMLGVGLVLGLVNRPQREVESPADYAWWDAELDGPS